jgi:hypothetical protein
MTQDIQNLTNEQLVELYDNLREDESQVKTDKKFVADEILLRLKKDGEVWGYYSVGKRVLKTIVLSDNKYEELRLAKELGATKEVVDQDKLKRLVNAGVKLPGEIRVTVSPNIRNISQEKSEI